MHRSATSESEIVFGVELVNGLVASDGRKWTRQTVVEALDTWHPMSSRHHPDVERRQQNPCKHAWDLKI